MSVIQQTSLESELNKACSIDPGLREVLALVGYPDPRERKPGFATLARIINSQQLSTRAAAAIWGRLESSCRGEVTARKFLNRDDAELRHCGLSARKVEYIRSLAQMVCKKEIEFSRLDELQDDQLVGELIRIRGLGRWSAEIYGMFAMGRTDLFPAGDLALRKAVQRYLKRKAPLDEIQVRKLALKWSPHRTAVSLLMWKFYGTTTLE